MSNELKFLNLAGAQYLVQKIRGEIPSDSYINTLITNKLSEYRDDIVTICSELPSEGEAGILYLIPNTNAQSNDVYITYVWEVVDNTTNPETYGFVQIGGTTFSLTTDSTVTEGSSNPVSGSAVFTALSGKANSSHTHGSITNDGKLSTASRVVVTDSSRKIGISSVTSIELGYLSGVTSAIQTQINSKLDSSSLTSDISSGSTNAVTGGGVFTALASKVNTSDIESITEPEIDVMFIGNNEIWIDATGWTTMNVLYDTNSQTSPGLALTKNPYGYYVFDISGLSTVDTFVISDTSSTNVTSQLATTLSGIIAYVGKIISVTAGSSEVTVLA